MIRAFGMLPYSFSKSLKCYEQNHLLQIYAIIQALLIAFANIFSWILMVFYNPLEINKGLFHNLLSVLSTNGGCLIVLYEKIFDYKNLLYIFNSTNSLYFNPRLFNAASHKLVLRGNMIFTVGIFTVMPLTFVGINFIGHIDAFDKKYVLITVLLTSIHMWLISSILPFLLIAWTIQNILDNINTKMKTSLIILNNKNKIESHFENQINELSIVFNKIVKILDCLTKHFSRHILLLLFIGFYNFVWHINVFVNFINASDISSHLFNGIVGLLFSLYFYGVMAIILFTACGITGAYDQLIFNLHNIEQHKFSDSLRVNVSC